MEEELRRGCRATKDLAELLRRTTRPSASFVEDAEKVRQELEDQIHDCVLRGANILFKPEDIQMPALHSFICQGWVGAVKACLETPKTINFRLEGAVSGETPVHCLCHRALSFSVLEEMLQALVCRLETHPEDEIEWGHTDFGGRTFLMLAAEHQRLSVVWPHVRHLPYFSDALQPFTLRCVWQSDWQALGLQEGPTMVPAPFPQPPAPPSDHDRKTGGTGEEENENEHVYEAAAQDSSSSCGAGKSARRSSSSPPPRSQQQYFTVRESDVIKVDTPTSMLCYFAWLREAPPHLRKTRAQLFYENGMAAEVQACVAAGAAVMLTVPVGGDFGLLHHFVEHGSVEVVRALMATPHPIAFSGRDPFGHTVLHCVCRRPAAQVSAVLCVLWDRLRRCQGPEGDTVFWRRPDGKGRDFLSAAADWRVLSVVWKSLQSGGLQSAVRGGGPIKLTARVYAADWNLLSAEDQAAFLLVSGHPLQE